MGELAKDTLYDVAQGLQFDNSDTLLALASSAQADDIGHDFNLGASCCLPKKATGRHDTLRDCSAQVTPAPWSS